MLDRESVDLNQLFRQLAPSFFSTLQFLTAMIQTSHWVSKNP